MRNLKKIKIHPTVQILLGFLGVILIGSFLLSLPISNSDGNWLNFVDSLFTSTTSVCVTGLVVVDMGVQFTLFGEIVILFLIQIGGLGIVVLTSLFFLMLKKKISLNGRLALKESLNKDSIQGVVKFIRKILIITFSIEGIGALLLLYSTITYSGSFFKGLYYAIFLSVSSFCHAGIDVLGEPGREFVGLNPFAQNVTMLLPLMMIIIVGSIGFVVISDIFSKTRSRQHWRVVLIMTAVLVLGGGLIFAILEWNNPETLGNMSTGNKILNAFFQSATTRTAGFGVLDQSKLTTGSICLTIFLMFIGGAPSSTAGGIKVTTLFVMLLFVFTSTNDNGDLRLRDRRIGRKIIMKAFRIFFYTLIMIVMGVILVSIFEPSHVSLQTIIFECVSAISTVGLSMGVTPLLTVGSKLVLIFLMFAGRVGILTIVMAITSRKEDDVEHEIEYINTDIMVG